MSPFVEKCRCLSKIAEKCPLSPPPPQKKNFGWDTKFLENLVGGGWKANFTIFLWGGGGGRSTPDDTDVAVRRYVVVCRNMSPFVDSLVEICGFVDLPKSIR